MKRSLLDRLTVGLWITLASVTWQGAVAQVRPDKVSGLDKPLPLDPAVVHGKLSNGVTYYVRENERPENRIELRLVVASGAALEEADQQGLAHFVEHMAFNGTKNFKKHELVDYLESTGIRFGADLNAYTNTDETVYVLQVPADKPDVVEKAFQVLEDWAHNITFDAVEIDKERGVIKEEWRSRRGADARIREKLFPVLFGSSRYAERNVIGYPELLDTFHHDRLRQFYKDWYRPEVMAVVAVGDFDKAKVQKLIEKYFGAIPASKNPIERTLFPVPDHSGTLFSIATDKELSRNAVSVYYKRPPSPDETGADYRRSIVESLYDAMLNQRLYEVTQQPEPPFLSAASSIGSLTPTKDAYVLRAGVADNGIERGLDALLTEAERVRRFGFTKSEFERTKVEMMRGMEQAYAERNKAESGSYAFQYVSHFLEGEPSPGIDLEFELVKNLLPGITVDEVNRLATEMITDNNRVIAVAAPDKAGVSVPTQGQLLAVFDAIRGKDITKYEEAVSDAPLVAVAPKPGTIVKEETNRELGTTSWTLSNGVRVILKPTTFKDDEIMFTAFSPGGSSLLGDRDYVNASYASAVVSEGGLGSFNQIDLQKKLAGKAAGASPFIGELQEGLNGGASPKDLETLMQLIYLQFTAPRVDSIAFASWVNRSKASLKNRNSRPETAFNDTIVTTLGGYHPRRMPITTETFDQLDLGRAFEIYHDRFADASDFTFIFVGNLDPSAMKPLVQQYLGGLPSTRRSEKWRDIGVRPPTGVVAKTVNKGVEQKSQVRLAFTGPFEWTRENRFALQAMADVLEIMLRENLREDKGGTYGVGVGAVSSQYPRTQYTFNIGFGCAPDRVDELVKAVFTEIESLKKNGPSAENLKKVQEAQRSEREVNLKENRYWLGSLQYVYLNQIDPMTIIDGDKLTDSLTAGMVQEAARKYLNTNNYVKVVLDPEKK